MDNWMLSYPGKRVTEYDICEIFCPAYLHVASSALVDLRLLVFIHMTQMCSVKQPYIHYRLCTEASRTRE